MAYASWSVSFGEQPSTAKWNILGTNDASFNNGTGIASLTMGATTAVTNSYKFSVFRTSALNVGTAATVVTYDTKNFDTGSNVDIVTNKGRFTAPITGYYVFFASFLVTTAGTGTNVATYFYKNGSQNIAGSFVNVASGTSPGGTIAALIQLNATQYCEVYIATATAAKALDVSSATNNVFEGFYLSV